MRGMVIGDLMSSPPRAWSCLSYRSGPLTHTRQRSWRQLRCMCRHRPLSSPNRRRRRRTGITATIRRATTPIFNSALEPGSRSSRRRSKRRKDMVKRWIMLILVMGVVSACATVPTGPNVMVLPGGGKPFDQFQADDVVCRQYAQQQLGLTPGQGAAQSTINTATLGTALGAAAGAAIGAATGHPGTGAAVGAGGGALAGPAPGGQARGPPSGGLQQRYDMAYVQCMYAKGNQVPGVATAPSPSAAPPPPPPPGANPPTPPRHWGKGQNPATYATSRSLTKALRGGPATIMRCGSLPPF